MNEEDLKSLSDFEYDARRGVLKKRGLPSYPIRAEDGVVDLSEIFENHQFLRIQFNKFKNRNVSEILWYFGDEYWSIDPDTVEHEISFIKKGGVVFSDELGAEIKKLLSRCRKSHVDKDGNGVLSRMIHTEGFDLIYVEIDFSRWVARISRKNTLLPVGSISGCPLGFRER